SSPRSRPPRRSSCRITGTSSTSSGSACSPSSTSSADRRGREDAPMTTTTPPPPTPRPDAGRGPRTRFRRRIAGAAALGIGLLVAGGAYVALTPAANVAHAQSEDTALIAQGQQLFNNACITCHGGNLQGVQDRGPSLIGVGDAAVWF